MSSSNYCFLACIQISQEVGKVVWYSHLLKNFPQFVVIHTVKVLDWVLTSSFLVLWLTITDCGISLSPLSSMWVNSYNKSPYIHITNKGPSSQSYGFSSSHVWIWEWDYKEGWEPKNWGFRTVELEKTLESPLDSKKIKPVNPKGNNPEYSLEGLKLKLQHSSKEPTH